MTIDVATAISSVLCSDCSYMVSYELPWFNLMLTTSSLSCLIRLSQAPPARHWIHEAPESLGQYHPNHCQGRHDDHWGETGVQTAGECTSMCRVSTLYDALQPLGDKLLQNLITSLLDLSLCRSFDCYRFSASHFGLCRRWGRSWRWAALSFTPRKNLMRTWRTRATTIRSE